MVGVRRRWARKTVEIDLATFIIPKQWSAHDDEQKCIEWRDRFYDAQHEMAGLLEEEPAYLGYFEDPGFPENEDALDLAIWRRSPGLLMLQFSGSEGFRNHPQEHLQKRLRLRLITACGPLSDRHRKLAIERRFMVKV
jgi:hypothetical protein